MNHETLPRCNNIHHDYVLSDVVSAVSAEFTFSAEYTLTMNSQRSTEIKVGAVTLLSLLLLIIGIVLGRNVSVSTGKPTLKILFPHSGGLENGAVVSVNGMKRGMVTGVEPYQSNVLVTATMDDVSDLRTDAQARILMLEITGGKKIDITPGSASASALPSGAIMRGTTPMDVSELIAFVGDVAGDARLTLHRLDTTLVALNDILNDKELIGEARSTLKHINALAVNANELLLRNQAPLERALVNLNELSLDLKRLTRRDGPVDTLITKLDNFLTQADTLVGNVNYTLKGADKLVVDLRGLISDVRSRKSVINQLLYDETFARRLDSTLQVIKKIFDNLPTDGVNVNVRLGSRP